jgi:cytochrome b561
MMMLHKSFGVTMLGLLVPRLALRAASKIPASLPGPTIQHYAGHLSHAALYSFMIFMPVSGAAMVRARGRGEREEEEREMWGGGGEGGYFFFLIFFTPKF